MRWGSLPTSPSGDILVTSSSAFQSDLDVCGEDAVDNVVSSCSWETRSASGMEDPGFKSHLRWDFSGSSHTIGLKNGTSVATLLDA